MHRKCSVTTISSAIMDNSVKSSGFLWILELICFSQEVGEPVWSISIGCCHHPCHRVSPQGGCEERSP